MGRSALLLIVMGALVMPVQAALTPRTIKTVYTTPDVVIAVAVVQPPRSGADASAAIQAAIDRVAAAGGGTIFLPCGRYRLETPITLKEGVALRGDRPLVGSDGKGTWRPLKGPATILMPVHGRGSEDGPAAITMERGTGLCDLVVWYPEQKPEDVVPYPWTVAGSTRVSGDNYTVRNVLFINPYQAMKFGPEWNELHTIRDVTGTPLRTGIFVDTCTDIGRLTDVHFSPLYWQTTNLSGRSASDGVWARLRQRLLKDAVGLDIGRSDWEYLYGVRIGGYGTAFRFRPGAQGTTNAVLYGCKAEGCRIGLDVVETNAVGLSATECRFDGREHGVLTRLTFSGVLQLNDCEVLSQGLALLHAGRGSVTACRSRFIGHGAPVVEARSGTLAMLGCRASGPGPHVKLGAAVKTARIVGCDILLPKGAKALPVTVEQDGPGDVVVSAGAVKLDAPVYRPKSCALPRPQSNALVNAATHGVSPDAADNTAALQRALNAAGKTGGTVYLAAGRYRINGALVVPSGVELRGSFDVPHHTISGGTVLLATGGRGKENGAPLISLKPGSGVRGLTVWYPEQDLTAPVAYPWTIRALGPKCRLTDVTIGNAWQGVDFFTHPSTGHRILYLAGGYLRRGLFVSKSDGGGHVEDVQFNPHYMARLPQGMPQPTYAGDPFGQVIEFQQAKLEGIVFGRCKDQQILRTFLYSALDGLRFANDGGGTSGIVINHGTDAGSRAITFDAVGSRGLDLLNTQLVILGKSQVASIVTTPGFAGKVRFLNTQLWAGSRMARLEGKGRVTLQQFNNLTGPIEVAQGTARFDLGVFQGNWRPAISLGEDVGAARVVGCIQSKGLLIEDRTGKARRIANSDPPKPRPGPTEFRSGFETADPAPEADAVQDQGGGIRSVSGLSCRPAPGMGRNGSVAMRLSGNADDPAHSFVYCRLFRSEVIVQPDTVLSYWIKPMNGLSRKSGLDLLFDDGTTLRDSGASDTERRGAHPGTDRGEVGEWRQIVVPLGHKAGDAITTIMLAFDGRPGGGSFEVLVDDVEVRRRSRNE